jgi:hypothetical protein
MIMPDTKTMDTKTLLELMRREGIRPEQVVGREVVNPDDDPTDWVNQGDENLRPGGWVEGDQVVANYNEIYAGMRRYDRQGIAQPVAVKPGTVFEQAYALALAEKEAAVNTGAVERLVCQSRQSSPIGTPKGSPTGTSNGKGSKEVIPA